jgi:2-oxoglutarate dehydrogenase complex dehydrogenase (E1) component-like enzyme
MDTMTADAYRGNLKASYEVVTGYEMNKQRISYSITLHGQQTKAVSDAINCLGAFCTDHQGAESDYQSMQKSQSYYSNNIWTKRATITFEKDARRHVLDENLRELQMDIFDRFGVMMLWQEIIG